jgi:hypothetical protein
VVDALSRALAKVSDHQRGAKAAERKLTSAALDMDPQKYATFWVNYEAQAKQWAEWAEAREKCTERRS